MPEVKFLANYKFIGDRGEGKNGVEGLGGRGRIEWRGQGGGEE